MAVYEGAEDYIFVSYSHRDSSLVLPIVTTLQSRGFRAWYDPGIEPGAEWPEYIAEHINDCRILVAFMSQNAASSPNCRQEIYHASRKGKDVLVVYLENTELSAGMEMKLGPLQAIKRSKFRSDAEFIDSLCSIRMLQSCCAANSNVTSQSAGGQNYLVDRDVLARFVDTIFGASLAAAQQTSGNINDIDSKREDAIQALDETIGMAVFSQFTEAQNAQFNALLDSERTTDVDYDRFFRTAGIDVEKTIAEAMQQFAIDYAAKLTHHDTARSVPMPTSSVEPVSDPQIITKTSSSPYAGVGRNDPCPCGSGKKFKKCHGVRQD